MNTKNICLFLAVIAFAGVTSGCAKWNNDKAVLATGLTASSSTSAIAADAARLTWTAPTQNTDNSALTDLAGYKVKYCNTGAGCTSGAPTVVDVGNVTTYTVTSLATGTWYFVVSSYDTASNNGPNSTPEVSKAIP